MDGILPGDMDVQGIWLLWEIKAQDENNEGH